MEFLQPPIVHVESSHQGSTKNTSIGFEVSAPNIIITVIKRQYEGNGIVIRAVESIGDESLVYFNLSALSTSWQSHFRPFEVKSFLIEGGKAIEINGIEDTIKVKEI